MIMIKKAQADEHRLLTEISFASKRFWDYPADFFETWKDELTLNREYLIQNDVFTIRSAKTIAGYYSLVELENNLQISETTLEAGHWLDHMFILPAYIGKGLGEKLFHHCIRICRLKSIQKIGILSDPNAIGFYLKMGCNFISDFPSTIAGRTTPYLEYPIEHQS